ncbi:MULTISPECIES: DNA polymerase III subunit delta' [Moorena]|uniref:DNA polymerase III, delta prime subunit n=1 Tax=Moorena producens 3L TaxID=489825 RepID=F4XV43_9CYAN|nr:MULTISPECIES: DNA polymerase III subunit delta' [Moorena]NES81066.1 DNA polymerase III subunit delta' [Moorena sp. SIO2B7]EGJ31566.1 DNA polymerase III, delta prime subunit [Moorena producens 3L]NEP31601.1 DNA polymerase III subunit delta' [Moorena sp. SIO3B2]NEP67721.1 DNA polymerase III subunit delta' [Moorena sp. SIO3A5]NES43018.1 DNA polymerase III subunit delta' [Moorena sp. SIO2C4]
MVPGAFDFILGQDQAIALLNGAITTNRIAPAYLFAGPSGVGRSLVARAFIEQLFGQGIPADGQVSIKKRLIQGNHPDVLWVEPTYLQNGTLVSATEAVQKGIQRQAPPQIRLEQIREIARFLSNSPLEASRKVVVLEQAETMAEPAANGLLKTLEEPGNATLIVIAPNTESLLPTLVSRCQRIPFSRLGPETMTTVLWQTGHQQILQEPSVLAIAQGSPGEAIAAFEQLKAMPPNLLTQLTQLPHTSRQALALAKEIDNNLDTHTQLWLVKYLQHCYWQSHTQPEMIKKLEQARRYLLSYAQPRLVWEVTLLELSILEA